MIPYLLECIAFQLVFLIIYDLFLKRETFFQWNRGYLIGTYSVSMVLPWIKIEALKTRVPEVFYGYPEYLWNSSDAATAIIEVQEGMFRLSWPYVVFCIGAVLALGLLVYKLFQIYKLRESGEVRYYQDFTEVTIPDSTVAFSFFKSIFLGDRVLEKEYQRILDHELVHIRQRHSYDLIFFEMMRIVAWFNPLAYVYQSRVSELHEFIADAKVAKNKREDQYELLLSQVFQTQNISFINQFFKTSLIKKRIVMLQKTRSKNIYQLKYLVLVPILMGMLFYTSLEGQETNENGILVEEIEDEVPENNGFEDQVKTEKKYLELLEERKRLELDMKKEAPVLIELDKQLAGLQKTITSKEAVPFAKVEEVPVFPGCEGAKDSRACFQQKMMRHISKNFNYPKAAQKKGLQGMVSLLFTINEKGLVQNLKLRGPHKLLEEEAERIIKRLPKMSPGKHKGEVVGVTYSIPISFKLGKSEGEMPKTDGADSSVPFGIVDQVPVFPGCEDEENKRACFNASMQRHISKNFNYPKEAQEKSIQGRVNIMFTIGKDGVIKNLRMRGPDKLLEEEAKRIIMRLPDMKPGRHKGKNVDVPFSIPISFRLQKETEGLDMMKLISNDPVYFVDGKEVSKEELNMINPDAIESMSVLKGEAAQTVYGEKGKNGVVQITLKKED
ncbi:TonB family protein [Maribacter sp. 2307UL18-2]|uniref:TonB family protein n=1 Tax=Maribacter sp. 2307UL18-2 TaxID=3386274 RepID=UPI0039BD70C9